MRIIVAMAMLAGESAGMAIAQRGDVAISVMSQNDDSSKVASLNVGLLGTVDSLSGVQSNVLVSFARKDMQGLQLSGFSNFAQKMQGVQLSAFSNIGAEPFRGVQLSGVANIAMGVERGLQLSGIANVSSSYMRGVQIGGYNYADTLNGSQVGFVNVALSHPRGVQIGLVNYTRDTLARKIGLVNVNPQTKIDFMVFGSTASKLNLALRFRNRSTYSMVGVGTHYMGFGEDFSGALTYRLGQYFLVNDRFSLSADVGFNHIETFHRNSDGGPERLFSLQARLNADYRLNERLAVFATVGWGDTRRYHHWRRWRSRPIFEAGVALRYGQRRMTRDDAEDMSYVAEDSTEMFVWDNPQSEKKHPWRAAAEAVGINVLVNRFDSYVLDEDFAKVSWQSVRDNVEHGFVWDNDQFATNLFAHPYHGGLYFNSARSNGLTFWESVPYSFGGSLMWEVACETEPPAINDLIATTIGGVCIGEVTHRVSDLVYDDRERGFRRFLRELAGAALCPIKALNRIITGDAWRVRHKYYKYHDLNRQPVDFTIGVGDRYLADNGALFRGEQNPYVDLSLVYGDAFDNEDTRPYDYFTANVTFGLSANQPLINGVHLLGRIWGVDVYESKNTEVGVGVFQHFNYYDSEAVRDGSSKVPYRISEAASFGPGLIYRFPKVGNLGRLEQHLFCNAILLGGSLSDYYNVIDRDYNMGSGFSVKSMTLLEFPRFGKFSLMANYYRIFTWKGYDNKDLTSANPLYLNAQGDRGSAALFVVNPMLDVYLKNSWSINLSGAYYQRKTKYKHFNNVSSDTFDVRIGLSYRLN